MVIQLRWPNALASSPASRKVLRNKETNSSQLSQFLSGISWYHFKASSLSRPWNILYFASKSSWLSNVMDLNLENQSSTFWLPSPWNLLYFRWVGILSLKDSSLSDLNKTSSTKSVIGDLSLLSSGSGIREGLAVDPSSWVTTTRSSSNPEAECIFEPKFVPGKLCMSTFPLFFSSQADFLADVPPFCDSPWGKNFGIA